MAPLPPGVDADALEDIGDVLDSLGEYTWATAAFEAGAKHDRLAGIEHQLGRSALRRGDPASEVEADRIRGLVARDRGDHEAARRSLEQSRSDADEMADPIAAANAQSLQVREDGHIEQAIGSVPCYPSG